jgi:hypothetical protein
MSRTRLAVSGYWSREWAAHARGLSGGGGPGVVAAGVAAGFTPAEVAMGARVIRTGSGAVAVWVVTGWPSEAYPGWLDPLLSWPGRLDLSLHLAPVDPVSAAAMLRRRLARLEATRRHDEQHERLPDPAVAAAAEDAAELAARVARGQGRLMRVGLYLAVHAPDLDALADDVAAVRALASALLLDVRPATWRQWAGWRSCVPAGVDELDIGRVMDTTAVSSLFPFSSPDLPPPAPTAALEHDAASRGAARGLDVAGDVTSAAPPDGPMLGLTATGLLTYDRFDPARDNHNATILGQSGAGKSYLIKLEILRQLYRGVHALVIDPEDEYTAMTTAVGGTVLRLGAAGVRLNPLDLPTPDHHGARDADDREPAGAGDALATRAAFLATAAGLMIGAPLDEDARAALDDATSAVYAAAGITADPATWARPAPTLVELSAHLAAGPAPGRRLARRLRPYTHGAYAQVFAGPTTTAAAGPLVSFSLRALPDEARPVATLLALEHIWRTISDPATLRRRLVVIDEAWLLMASPEAAAFLARLAKAGRKRWAGLTFASQDVTDVIGSPLGLSVLANSATTILLRQAPRNLDQLAGVCHLSAGDAAYLRGASRGHALLCTDTGSAAFAVVASEAEDRWIRSDPAYLATHPAAPASTAHLTTAYQSAADVPADDRTTGDPARGEPAGREPAAGEPAAVLPVEGRPWWDDPARLARLAELGITGPGGEW